jgi:sugar O-acyltransferase (sialic acid O-acetyltransferase NeuD family)
LNKQIIIVGGGGHCKSVIEVIESSKLYLIKGILNKAEAAEKEVCGYPVIGTDHEIPRLIAEGYCFHIAVGHIKNGEARKTLFNRIQDAGGEMPVIVASTATVSSRATLAQGTIIMHRAFVNADAQIGFNCIINTGAVIEHDAYIDNHCHISTGAYVNGACKIGELTFIGSSSVLVQGVEVAAGNVIAAGTVVTQSTKPGYLYAGIPAQPKKQIAR